VCAEQRIVREADNGDVRSRPGTFDLLGFTHYWAKSRKGYWVVKQKTAADRLRRALKRMADWCRRYRHEPVRDQWTALKRKLVGHFGYFGITGNYQALHNFLVRVIGAWRKWLSRRSQRAWISREKMKRLLEAVSAAAAAHPHFPGRVAKPWTEEPDAEIRTSGSVGASGSNPRGDPTSLWPDRLCLAVGDSMAKSGPASAKGPGSTRRSEKSAEETQNGPTGSLSGALAIRRKEVQNESGCLLLAPVLMEPGAFQTDSDARKL
jgi:hypothetical protein